MSHPVVNDVLWQPSDISVRANGQYRKSLISAELTTEEFTTEDDVVESVETLTVKGLYPDNRDLGRSREMGNVDFLFQYPERHTRHLWCVRARVTHTMAFGDVEPVDISVHYRVVRSVDDCRCDSCTVLEVMES